MTEVITQERQIIDPLQQLRNGNPLAVLACIDHIDLSTLVDPGTPLIHYICKNFFPLDQIFGDKKIEPTKNVESKTPLFSAVEAQDIHAVYWCLKNQTVKNNRSVTGHTATMQCLKQGFRAGFLLCLSFGHITDDLGHMAASANDVWALKILNTMNVDLTKKDHLNMSPLEIAIETYSYDSAYYLAELMGQQLRLDQLTLNTKSKEIVTKLEQIVFRNKFARVYELFHQTFLFESFFLLTIFFLINSFPKFQDSRSWDIQLTIQFMLILLSYKSVEHDPKPNLSIQQLLRAPRFPQVGDICPHCIQIKQENYEHCTKCDMCVKGFHMHEGNCICQKNQGRWFFKELGWFILFRCIVNYYMVVITPLLTATIFKHVQIFEILYYQSNFWCNDLIFYSVIYYWMIKKGLRMVELMYMLATGYNYQQLYHNQRYQYLYKVIKVGQHFKNKRIYLFDNGVTKGLKKILTNALSFFF